MDLTVVIPVKNGGALFEQVLERLLDQKTNLCYEIIIVDSGSTDGSREFVRRCMEEKLPANCTLKLHEIRPEDFGHGKTRNLGASLGTGRYISFLTQDALPADDNLLQNLVDGMECVAREPERPKLQAPVEEQVSGARQALKSLALAGGFGQHLPYPDCNPCDKQMLEMMFRDFGAHPCDTNHFFSDNCSILRRDIWEKIPYEDTDFAEDQKWAEDVAAAGYQTIYIPEARIYHSHNFELSTYGKRYFDDFKAQYRIHGLNLCPNVYRFFRQAIGDTRFQWGYIRRQDYSGAEKRSWYLYALRRNFIRCHAARLAVKYYRLSSEEQVAMDQRFSQQASVGR